MTWTVTHTIPYVDGTSNASAMTYLFGTYLPARAGWTINAHPDASAFKRSVRYTFTNNVFNNASYTAYMWVNYSSATTTTGWTWYEDATYTSTPGDLGTNTINSLTNNNTWNGAWKFCASSENANSALVLNGSNVAFYFPGVTTGLFFPDATWLSGGANGATQNKGTAILPQVGHLYGGISSMNAPTNTNTSSTEHFMIPSLGFVPSATSGGLLPAYGNIIGTNFDWWYSASTTSNYPGSESQWAFSNGHPTDMGIWMPNNLTNTGESRRVFDTAGGTTLQIGSNYWLFCHTNLGLQRAVFNFGNVDPLV